MFRSRTFSFGIVAALLLATVVSLTPRDAAANGNMGGQTGVVGNIYVVDVYYAVNGQWVAYARYFATQYTNGWDFGGADSALSYLNGQGYQTTYNAQFWRTTYNGG